MECDENFEHRLDQDFGLYPKVAHFEKIDELHQVTLRLLRTFV